MPGRHDQQPGVEMRTVSATLPECRAGVVKMPEFAAGRQVETRLPRARSPESKYGGPSLAPSTLLSGAKQTHSVVVGLQL